MEQEKIPVQFIRCTEEQICFLREQSKVSKNEMKNSAQEQIENSTEKVVQETSENSIETEEK